MLPTVDFKKNWNGKLFNRCFTSIRPANANKYQAGKFYQITLEKKPLFNAQLVRVRLLNYHQIDDWIAGLDCGHSAPYLKKLLDRFYPKANWSMDKLYYLLFKNEHYEKHDPLHLQSKPAEIQGALFQTKSPGLQANH